MFPLFDDESGCLATTLDWISLSTSTDKTKRISWLQTNLGISFSQPLNPHPNSPFNAFKAVYTFSNYSKQLKALTTYLVKSTAAVDN